MGPPSRGLTKSGTGAPGEFLCRQTSPNATNPRILCRGFVALLSGKVPWDSDGTHRLPSLSPQDPSLAPGVTEDVLVLVQVDDGGAHAAAGVALGAREVVNDRYGPARLVVDDVVPQVPFLAARVRGAVDDVAAGDGAELLVREGLGVSKLLGRVCSSLFWSCSVRPSLPTCARLVPGCLKLFSTHLAARKLTILPAHTETREPKSPRVPDSACARR